MYSLPLSMTCSLFPSRNSTLTFLVWISEDCVIGQITVANLTDDDAVMAEKLLSIFEAPAHRNALGEAAKNKFRKINDAPKYKQAIYDCYKR